MDYGTPAPGGPKAKRRGRTTVVIILIVLAVLAGAIVAFFALDIPGWLALRGQAPQPFFAEGEVRAFTLPAGEGAALPREELKAEYKKALEDAAGKGYNTVVYPAKGGLAVYWRDNIFPPVPEMTGGDTWLYKKDNLAVLCEAAEGTGVQVWVEIDAYSAAGYTGAMRGKAAKFMEDKPTQLRLDATDAGYAQLLQQSLGVLPQRYPIAGLVFANLNQQAEAPTQDVALWGEGFAAMLEGLHATWQQEGYETQLMLGLAGDEDYLVSPALAHQLVEENRVKRLLVAHEAGPALIARMAPWHGGTGTVVAVPPATGGEVVLFTAAGMPGYAGVLAGQYGESAQQAAQTALLLTALQQPEGEKPTGFALEDSLAVTYPPEGASVSSDALFVMGRSNPALPLLFEGREVERRGAGGTFGVEVALAEGENRFTFEQSGETVVLKVTRVVPQPPAAGAEEEEAEPAEPPSDGTREAEKGQAVRIDTVIASALSAAEGGGIVETLNQGAVAVVQESVEIVQNGEKTWMYQLTSGDWVYAYNCTWVDQGNANFTGLAASEDELGEWIEFEGSGTPAAYIEYEAGVLRLWMFDTAFALPAGFTSHYVKTAGVRTTQRGAAELTLEVGDIWGYHIEYGEGKTRLFLKSPPALGQNPALPLEGVRVMLDPGHGGDDIGTPGVMWQTGPYEKDVNLRLANTIAYRLRQLGAEVLMTREDDTEVSLAQRLQAQAQHKPHFFISVHHNSAEPVHDLNDAKGLQVYYFHPYAVAPSQSFGQSLIDAIAADTGRAGGAAREDYYYVTRTTVCPSVLFEYGFLINPEEFEDLTSTDGIYASALATVDGILASIPQADAVVQEDTAQTSQAPQSGGSAPQSENG